VVEPMAPLKGPMLTAVQLQMNHILHVRSPALPQRTPIDCDESLSKESIH